MRYTFWLNAVVGLAVVAGSSMAGGQAIAGSSAGPPRSPAAAQGPGVLLVCNGSTIACPAAAPAAGPYYSSIQGAVDAARPGDWILVYPGVYHEKSRQWPTAGVWIDKPDLHIRGLDRNRVIIDGSNGTAAHPCPSAAAEQDFTPRDGIVVWKASGITIQNLTVCDYLSGPDGHGNEIWWNGGYATGQIGMGSFSGSYLTATSQYAPANDGATAPVGTGIQIAGGSYDTVTRNIIANQGAWGMVTSDNPDPEPPPPPSHCQGGIENDPAPGVCLFRAIGNRISRNVFIHDGFFGNQTNSDLATETLSSYTPRNCFYGNRDVSGRLTSAPAGIQAATVDGRPCTLAGTGNDEALQVQMICNTGFEPCPLPPSKARYPKQTRIMMLPRPWLPSMPDPCQGVPRNAFCS